VRNFSNKQVVKALLLAGGASTFAIAVPAVAQEAGAEEREDRIVVTGSRIQRGDFEANSPFVTVDEQLLQESASAALETSLNKLPQFVPAQTPTAGGDIQPTATNTPGAATVSLRGIGANRTLVLVDGRRSTPSNASGVTDISTIPSAAIQRIEVISGGASATYGADAVAGVTNFILKQDFEGLELDARLGMTQEGDGFEYQLGGIMGTDFADGRGNISLAMSINTREANFQRDRSWYGARYNDPSVGGSQFFIDRPGIVFTNANPFTQAALQQVMPGTCINTTASPCPIPDRVSTAATVYTNPDGSVFTAAFGSIGGTRYFNQPLDGFPYKQAATGAISQNNDDLYLVLPLTRYNFLARGNYELNDWIGIYGQGLFSHVTTYTRNEPGPITGGWGVNVPWGNDPYTGGGYATSGNISSVLANGNTNPAFQARYGSILNCVGFTTGVGGCTNTEAFSQVIPQELQVLLNARSNPNLPFALTTLMPDERETFTDVMTYNLQAGFEGYIPGSDWTWDVGVNHGESHTFALQTGIYSLNRVRALITAPNFGENYSVQGNAASGGFGASTGTCTTGYNFFAPGGAQSTSTDCREAVSADLKNRSKFRQTILEANVQGGLFELPAGELRAAFGASYRESDYQFLNDTLTTQGRSFQDQALGIYPSGNSAGFIKVNELYGELLVPVLNDLPLIDQLNLELGGRMSHYSTTGTSYTYKILGDWAVTDWIRIRGGFNKAERAPNIGELFLAPQQTFGVNNAGDACSTGNPLGFTAGPNNPNAANVQAMCRLMIARNDSAGTAVDNFYGNGTTIPASPGSTSNATFGFAFPTTIGNPNLSPENAKTWTAGIVVNSPFTSDLLSRLRLSVDWFEINVTDAIGVQSIGVAQRSCFDPAFNPDAATNPAAAIQNQFCQNITRNVPDGNLGNVFVTYANNGRFVIEGIDAQLDWSADLGPGTFSTNVLLNYMLDVKVAELPVDPLVDYVGTFGNAVAGLNGNTGYEYRVLTSFNYSIGPARVGITWQHYAGVDDTPRNPAINGAPAYNIFNLNTAYQLSDDINLRFGVENLFNKAPPITNLNTSIDITQSPTTGQLPGGGIGGGFYDTIGRRFFLGANIQF
jgi:iron complex outermembrane recepter protein